MNSYRNTFYDDQDGRAILFCEKRLKRLAYLSKQAEGQMDVMNEPSLLEQKTLRKLLQHQTRKRLRQPARQNRGGGRARE